MTIFFGKYTIHSRKGQGMKVSIITLSYNHLEDATAPFIESLYQYTSEKDFELIIVDNNSTDGTVDFLKKLEAEKSNVRVIYNAENLGYSKGNNQGLKIANPSIPYIALFNNDVLFTPNWLENSLLEFEKDSKIGLASPRINKNMKVMRKDEYLHKYKKYLCQFKESFTYDLMPRFCCVIFSRKLFEKVGYLDENFTPAFYEDDDYSLRSLYAGYRNGHINTAFIYHNHCTTSGNIEARNKLLERNRKYFYSKHYIGEFIYEKLGHGKSWIKRLFGK